MLNALQALVVNNPDFAELERFSDVYCPFEAVGMVRQEVRHGHFLAHCLDPARPHGFGTEALKLFLRAATEGRETDDGACPITALDAHLMRCEGAAVSREWRPAGAFLQDQVGRSGKASRLDLLIVIPAETLVVAVELKIDATEHTRQLRRYRAEVRRAWPVQEGWRHLLLYVTRDGEPPSEADGEGWLPLALGQIAAALDTVVEREVGAAPARAMLASYLSMLRRHIVTNDRAKELAARLWRQHREALEFLAERRPASGTGVMGRLFENREDLCRAMAQHGRTRLVVDHSTPTTIRFAVPGWDDLPNFRTATNWTSPNRLLLLEVAPDGDRDAIRVRFVLGPRPSEVRKRYYDLLVEAMPDLCRRQEITGTWTRLGSATLVRGLKADDVDPDKVAALVADKLNAYAKANLPRFDATLAALRTAKA